MNKWVSNSILILLLGVLFSCVKTEIPPEEDTNIKDLHASESFDWKSERSISILYLSEKSSRVLIHNEEHNLQFHKGFYNTLEESYQCEIEVPTWLNSIDVNGENYSISGKESLVIGKRALKNDQLDLDNLLGYWNFNEANVEIAESFDGKLPGTVHNSESVSGIQGNAIKLNGSDSWIEMENSADIMLGNQISMMAWVKVDEHKEAKIVQKGDWDGHNLGIGKWTGFSARIRTVDQVTHYLEWENGRPQEDTWYHTAFTYNGSTFIFYVNGVEVAREEVNQDLHINPRIICIGSDKGDQKFFKGTIDEAMIFTSALAPEIVRSYYKELPNSDSDGDGVSDPDDDFPDDATKAFENIHPASGIGTLAFEDLWPSRGDYDFNDLVLDYKFTTITSAENLISEVVADFTVRAIGASFKNGFGFQLSDNILDEDIVVTGHSLSDDFIQLHENGLEKGQDAPTVIVFDNAYKVLLSAGGSGINTNPEGPIVDPVKIQIRILVKQGKYYLEDLDIASFNPFIIINKERGKEVHLPDYKPSSLASIDLLGSSADDSRTESGRYYKTENNLPWALNIPYSFNYPVEKASISSAHTKFISWVVSEGSTHQDWYQDKSGYRDFNFMFK